MEAQKVIQNPVNISEKRCILCVFTPDSGYNSLSVVEPDGIVVPLRVDVPGSPSFVYAFGSPPQKTEQGTWKISEDTLPQDGNNNAQDENGFTVIFVPSPGQPVNGQIVLYQIVSQAGWTGQLPHVDNAPVINGAHTAVQCPLPPAMTPLKPGEPYSYQDSPSGADLVWQCTAVAVCRSGCQDLQLLGTYYFEFDAKTRTITKRDPTYKKHFKTGMDRWWNGDATRNSYYPNVIFW